MVPQNTLPTVGHHQCGVYPGHHGSWLSNSIAVHHAKGASERISKSARIHYTVPSQVFNSLYLLYCTKIEFLVSLVLCGRLHTLLH